MFNRTSNERSVQATGIVLCVIELVSLPTCWTSDGVIFMGVIINIRLVKVAGHAHIHYPATLTAYTQS